AEVRERVVEALTAAELWDLDAQHEQRDRDREHAVAEGDHALVAPWALTAGGGHGHGASVRAGRIEPCRRRAIYAGAVSSSPPLVAVVPALDEAATIGAVVDGAAASCDEVVVVDNGSVDATAARAGLHVREVPVDARPRGGGESKVSGTLGGTVRTAARFAEVLVRDGLGPRR